MDENFINIDNISYRSITNYCYCFSHGWDIDTIHINIIYIYIRGFNIIIQEAKNVAGEAGAHPASPVDTPMILSK